MEFLQPNKISDSQLELSDFCYRTITCLTILPCVTVCLFFFSIRSFKVKLLCILIPQ